jgi:hypothetical protein
MVMVVVIACIWRALLNNTTLVLSVCLIVVFDSDIVDIVTGLSTVHLHDDSMLLCENEFLARPRCPWIFVYRHTSKICCLSKEKALNSQLS